MQGRRESLVGVMEANREAVRSNLMLYSKYKHAELGSSGSQIMGEEQLKL